jgi:predicted Mrr-cat superfamily restriction endonuclease
MPEAKAGRVNNPAGHLFRFVNAINIGDWVLTPDRDRRTVFFGKIKSDYYFSPNCLRPGSHHCRKVEWMGEIKRDSMSASLKSSMASFSTMASSTG